MYISTELHDMICEAILYGIIIMLAVFLIALLLEWLTPRIKAAIRHYTPIVRRYISKRRYEKAIKYINEHPYHSYKIKTR